MNGQLFAMRIQRKGKITDLSSGFKLDGKIFTIFVKPRSAVDPNINITVNCKLVCDDSFGDFPVPLNDWTPGSMVAIAPNAIDLESYDVYYGAAEEK